MIATNTPPAPAPPPCAGSLRGAGFIADRDRRRDRTSTRTILFAAFRLQRTGGANIRTGNR